MGADTSSRSRRLLTFRLDRELRQRLKTRLAGEGRTMSEVVILGLQMYVQHSSRFSGSGPAEQAHGQEHDQAHGQEHGQGPGQAHGQEQDQGAESPAAGSLPEVAGAEGTVPEVTGAEGAVPQVTGPERAAPEVTRAPAEQAVTPAQAPFPVLAEPEPSGRKPGRPTTVVVSAADLALPDHLADYLCSLRECGHSDLLSATLARLHDVGWPLRPLAAALGISRQAVQARICQQVSAEVQARVLDVPPPSAFPRRRPALPSGRRPHLTVKIDQALRAAAHKQALREGSSLSQVIEKILDYYLRHGLPTGEIQLGDTTPTRPAPRRRHRQHVAALPPGQEAPHK